MHEESLQASAGALFNDGQPFGDHLQGYIGSQGQNTYA